MHTDKEVPVGSWAHRAEADTASAPCQARPSWNPAAFFFPAIVISLFGAAVRSPPSLGQALVMTETPCSH